MTARRSRHLRSEALEEDGSRCKIKVAGKFIQGKAGGARAMWKELPFPDPRCQVAWLGAGPAAHPWEGSSSVTSSMLEDPGPSPMRLSIWNIEQNHNSRIKKKYIHGGLQFLALLYQQVSFSNDAVSS